MRSSSIQLKTPQEIEAMRLPAQVVGEVLNTLRKHVKIGVTTGELDELARELTEKNGATPAFLGYPSGKNGVPPFSGVICSSVNEEIVHGIPGSRKLQSGDVISIDYGCAIDGFFGDAAVTVAVGEISARAAELLVETKASLQDAIAQCYAGKRIGDISHAVQSRVEKKGFGVVREFVGHGIGRAMHEPPHVPNFGRPGQGRVLKPGMVLAIEPMVTCGSYETKVLADGWTAVTKDASLAAHFEHTVAITSGDPIILTQSIID